MNEPKTNIVINSTASATPSSSRGATINLSLTLQSRSPEALATYLDELAKAVRENRGSAPSMFPGVIGTVGWVK